MAACAAAVKGVSLLADLSERWPLTEWDLETGTHLQTALFCTAALIIAALCLLMLAADVCWLVQLRRGARDLRELGQSCQPE